MEKIKCVINVAAVRAQGQEHSESCMGAGGGHGAVPTEMHSSGADHDSDAGSTGGGVGGEPGPDMEAFKKMVTTSADTYIV